MSLVSCLVVAVLISSCATILLSSGASEGAIMAVEDPVNGNQELVSDPERPLVYSGDTDGDKVHVFNASTRAEMWNVSVGYSPMSIDISDDGRYLYVAVSLDRTIVVVDQETRAVSKTIDLEFQPLSVRIGLSDRLYVTYVDENTWEGGLGVIDETTGNVLENETEYGTGVLEMSPDRTVLLMLRLRAAPLPLYKFSCDGPRLEFLDRDDDDIYRVAEQMAVDWGNEIIYIALDSVSVATFSLATLDMMSSIYVGEYVNGIALSPDRTIVFCTAYDPWGSFPEDLVWAFNASDGTLIAKYPMLMASYTLTDDSYLVDSDTFAAITAPPCAGAVVAVGRPVQFLDLGEPKLFPEWPWVDSTMYYEYYGDITAEIFPGIPACDITSYEMRLDGEILESCIYSLTLYGMLSEPLTDGGEHTVDAMIAWNGGTVSISWRFNLTAPEHIVSMSPAEGEGIGYVPDNITIVLDLGYPERTITASQVTVNGESPVCELDGGVMTIDTQNGGMNLTLPGRNWVVMGFDFEYVLPRDILVTSSIQLIWDFNITDVPTDPSLEGLSWHNLSSGVSLMLPTTWDVADNVTVSDSIFDTQAIGPVNGTVRPEITLQSAVDPGITEDELWMDSFAEDFIDGMQEEEGFGMYLVDAPSERDIPGYETVVFSVRWAEDWTVQKIAVIADLATGEYWLLTMTVATSCYFDQNPMFEGVISSFSVSEQESTSDDPDDDPGPDPIPPWLVLAGIAAAGVAAFVVTFWIGSRPRTPPTS